MSATRPSKRILILFAHPAFQRSRVNRALVAAARELPGVTLHDLYEAYPDLDIDVEAEQSRLAEHDIIVLQHPFYWYSTPAILKEWQDLVLEHGWAYGREGAALAGKILLNAITAGGSEGAYRAGGHNRFTVRQLLAPLELTAELCGMRFLPPFVVYGTHLLVEDDVRRYAREYCRALERLRDDRIDLEAVKAAPSLNHWSDAVDGG